MFMLFVALVSCVGEANPTCIVGEIFVFDCRRTLTQSETPHAVPRARGTARHAPATEIPPQRRTCTWLTNHDTCECKCCSSIIMIRCRPQITQLALDLFSRRALLLRLVTFASIALMHGRSTRADSVAVEHTAEVITVPPICPIGEFSPSSSSSCSPWPNLARLGQITASCWDANSAFSSSGCTDGVATDPTACETCLMTNPWLTVRLEQPALPQLVRIFNRGCYDDFCLIPINGFRLYVTATPPDPSLLAVASSSLPGLIYDDAISGPVTVDLQPSYIGISVPNGTLAQYVTILLPSNNYLHMQEIEVFASSCQTTHTRLPSERALVQALRAIHSSSPHCCVFCACMPALFAYPCAQVLSLSLLRRRRLASSSRIAPARPSRPAVPAASSAAPGSISSALPSRATWA